MPVMRIPWTTHHSFSTASLTRGNLDNMLIAISLFIGGAPAPGPYHHYTFELFALDTKLSLGPSATEAEVLKAMDGHVLAKGVLVGRFHLP